MLSQIPKNWDAQKISKIQKSPNKSNSNNTETKRIFSFLKAGGFGFEIVSGEAATTSPYRSFFSSCFGPYLLGVDMSTFPLCVMKIYYACFTMQRYTVHLGWWTSMIRWQSLPNHECSLTLEYVYIFKAYTTDAYPCFIGSEIYHVCDCPHPCQLVTCGFTMCMKHTTCLVLRCASVCLRPSILVHAVHTNMKPCRCAMVHLTWIYTRFFPWKYGNFLPYFHCENLVRITLCVPWRTWSKILSIFCNKK